MTAKDIPVKARSRRSGAADQPALSREVIIEATLAYIDEVGLESFSLRNLAAKLGVYPTAIYWYVPNRDELLAQVVALVLEKVGGGRKRRALPVYLRELFHSFRAVLREHPNVAPLVGTQLVSNTNMDLGFVEQLLSALARAGLSDGDLVGAYNSVIAAIIGFTAQEFAPVPTENSAEWQKKVRVRLENISRDEYPMIAKNLSILSNKAFILRWENGIEAPLDESFRIYIEVIIAGIEKMIPNP